MPTKKDLQNQINVLTEKVNELTEIVITDELRFLKEEKKHFDEQTALLSDVKFRVKSVKVMEEDNSIVVVYQLPVITLKLDEQGNPIEKIPFFYAVNALGMVGVNDYEAIQNAINHVKKLKEIKKNTWFMLFTDLEYLRKLKKGYINDIWWETQKLTKRTQSIG